MLPENLARVLKLPDEALVLDVGAWAAPVNRADWVIDMMPYATRGALMPSGFGPQPERFTAERWVLADICAHEPWPFADDQFDFAICTYTLEDVRDPIRVCQEMSRVARAGYIEVPSTLEELRWRLPEPSGGEWVGHQHHRWLCSLQDDELVFLSKIHSLHSDPTVRVLPQWGERLTHDERVIAHFWEGSLPARERPTIDAYPLAELAQLVQQRFGADADRGGGGGRARLRRQARDWLARLQRRLED